MNTKRIRTLLLSVVTMLHLVCLTYAETECYTIDRSGIVSYNETNGTYTASYSDALCGKDYVLLVVAKSADGSRIISSSTVMYMNQKTANEDGVTFEFIPKGTLDCEVLLAGDFGTTPSPIVLGELVAQGITVTGKIINASAPIVQLGSGDRENFVVEYTAVVSDDGTFIFNGIPEGEYSLQVSQAYHIGYYKTSVTVSLDTEPLEGEISIYPGDLVPDGAINFSDLSLLIRNYGASDSSDSPADINGDGVVNFEDMSILISNYNTRASDLAE